MTMTFEKFQASRRESADLETDLGFDLGGGASMAFKGFIYAGDCYIEKMADGRFYLILGRADWISNSHTELEGILWAMHYLAEIEEAPILSKADGTLTAFIVGACNAFRMPIDGDYFGHAFSAKDEWPYAEAEDIMLEASRNKRLLEG